MTGISRDLSRLAFATLVLGMIAGCKAGEDEPIVKEGDRLRADLSECPASAPVCRYWAPTVEGCLLVDSADGEACWETGSGFRCRAGRCLSSRPGCLDARGACRRVVKHHETCELTTPEAGTPCDDGVACTAESRCDGGSCVPGRILDCGGSDACTEAMCVVGVGCRMIARELCDDFDPCTVDRCDPGDGSCVHEPQDCDDKNPCTNDRCDTKGRCWHYHKDGWCEDGDPCTEHDRCRLGMCFAGSRTACDDGSACTDDHCEPGVGCTYTPACDDGDPCTTDSCSGDGRTCAHETTDCSDGLACTIDVCRSNIGCTHRPRCDDHNQCTVDLCSEDGGGCTHETLDCDDGLPCTIDECLESTGCVHTSSCFDGDPCTADICDGDTMACVYEPLRCDDGDPCTVDECHASGACVSIRQHCKDAHPCTLDVCVPEGGCRHLARDELCDDGVACTEDRCHPERGCGHVLADDLCDDGNPCTLDTCDGVQGCLHTPNGDGARCKVDMCTRDGSCEGGECVGAVSYVCEDGDPCTADRCDPATGHCVSDGVRSDAAVAGFETVGSLPAFGRGDVSAVLAEDGLVYVGYRDGLERTGAVEIYAVGEGGELSPVGRVPLHGRVLAMVKTGDTLLAAGGLWWSPYPPDADTYALDAWTILQEEDEYGYFTPGLGVLWSVDVSDPASPELVSALEEGRLLGDLSLDRSAGLLHAADLAGHVHFFDVADPRAPVHVDSLDTAPFSSSVEELGGGVVVGSEWGGYLVVARSALGGVEGVVYRRLGWGGVLVRRAGPEVFVLCPSAVVYRLDRGGAEPSLEELSLGDTFLVDIALGDGFWVAARGPAGGISTLSGEGTVPDSIVGTAGSPGTAEAVAVWERWAFLADGTQGLRVYDLSEPERPVEVSAVHRSGTGRALALRGDTVFLADGEEGLAIVDVEVPERPVEVSRLEGDLDARDVVLKGDVALLADAGRGLVAVDVADPGSPAVVAEVDPGLQLFGLGLFGERLYAPSDGATVAVFDVSEPRAPVLEERVRLSHRPKSSVSPAVHDGALLVRDPSHRMALVEDTGSGLARKLHVEGTYGWEPEGSGYERSVGEVVDWHLGGGWLVAVHRVSFAEAWGIGGRGLGWFYDDWRSLLHVGAMDSVLRFYDLSDPEHAAGTPMGAAGLSRVNKLEVLGQAVIAGSRELAAYDLWRRPRYSGQPLWMTAWHQTASVVEDMVRRDDLLFVAGSAGLEIIRIDFCGDCPAGPDGCVADGPCMRARCVPGAGCVSEPVPGVCDDGMLCTIDRCELDGSCSHEPARRANCDGSWCTGRQACEDGECVATEEVGGGSPCEPLECDPRLGVSVPLPPPCDDGEPCTFDACDPEEGCSHEPVDGAAGCDDGDPCNGVESCAEGLCTSSLPAPCPGEEPCGAWECVPFIGCTAVGCDDGDPCTRDTCGEEGCEHAWRQAPDCTAGCAPDARHLSLPRLGGDALAVAARGGSLYVVCAGCGVGRCERDRPNALLQIRADTLSPAVVAASCLPPGAPLGDLHVHGDSLWLLYGVRPWPVGSEHRRDAVPVLLSVPLDWEGRPGAPLRHPTPDNAFELVAHEDVLSVGLSDEGFVHYRRDHRNQPGGARDPASQLRGAELLMLDGEGAVGGRLEVPGAKWSRVVWGVHAAGRHVFLNATNGWSPDSLLTVVDREAAGGPRVVGAVALRGVSPIAYAGSELLVLGYEITEREPPPKLRTVDLSDPSRPRLLPEGRKVDWHVPVVDGDLMLGVPRYTDFGVMAELYALDGAEMPVELGAVALPADIDDIAFDAPFVHVAGAAGLMSYELHCLAGGP